MDKILLIVAFAVVLAFYVYVIADYIIQLFDRGKSIGYI
jgi:hypothetical protein